MKLIIVNTKAGRGKCKQIMPKIKEYYKHKNQQHIIVTTECPGHATELAIDGVKKGATEIIAVGGDGTLLEVIQGIYDEDVIIGAVPGGTGNDFVRSLGYSLEIDEFLTQFDKAVVRPVDLCMGKDRVFLTLSAVGFVTDVLTHVEKNRKGIMKGSLAFANAVFQSILKLKPRELEICVDGCWMTRKAVLIGLVNSPFTGGGMRFAPDAKIDDGVLYIFIVKEISKLELLRVFPRVYKGTHTSHPSVEILKCKEVKIKSKTPLFKNYDGTVMGTTPIDVKIAKQKLNVLALPRQNY